MRKKYLIFTIVLTLVVFIILIINFNDSGLGNDYTDKQSEIINSITEQQIVHIETTKIQYDTSCIQLDSNQTIVTTTLYESEENTVDINIIEQATSSESYAEIPLYWRSYLKEKIELINNLQYLENYSLFSFGVIADVHWPGINQNSPGLLKQVIKDCNIKYLLNLGDFANGNTTKQLAIEQFRSSLNIYRNLGALMLPVMGNHDDNAFNSNEELQYRVNNTIVKEEQSNLFHQVLGDNVVYGKNKTYYYTDYVNEKIRFIGLDVMDMTYQDIGKGYLICQYGYRQEQLNWLAQNALNVPSDGWSVVVFSHIPPYTSADMYGTGSIAPYNSDVLMGILEAFLDRSSYDNETYDTGDYNIDINADYSQKGGDVIALICGHTHIDHLLKWNNKIPVITTLDDCLHLVGSAPKKIVGTVSEQAFDIFTIDKINRTVYVTRIGAGSDRIFKY